MNDSREAMLADAKTIGERTGAPRVTPAEIDAAIDAISYFTAGQGCDKAGTPHHPSLDQLTLCCITTRNGFTVVGKSACVSPENFDKALGQRIAFDDAKRQLWPLLGYARLESLAPRT